MRTTRPCPRFTTCGYSALEYDYLPWNNAKYISLRFSLDDILISGNISYSIHWKINTAQCNLIHVLWHVITFFETSIIILIHFFSAGHQFYKPIHVAWKRFLSSTFFFQCIIKFIQTPRDIFGCAKLIFHSIFQVTLPQLIVK